MVDSHHSIFHLRVGDSTWQVVKTKHPHPNLIYDFAIFPHRISESACILFKAFAHCLVGNISTWYPTQSAQDGVHMGRSQCLLLGTSKGNIVANSLGILLEIFL